jgi:hypothetical protein
MNNLLTTIAGTAFAISCLCAGCERHGEHSAQPAQHAEAKFQGTIVAMGDSLTAGLGVNENDAYPAQLERKLRQGEYRWQVLNAGISGETSSGALTRIGWVLKLKPDIVILETGANDGMRGTDPQLMRKNIEEMLHPREERRRRGTGRHEDASKSRERLHRGLFRRLQQPCEKTPGHPDALLLGWCRRGSVP